MTNYDSILRMGGCFVKADACFAQKNASVMLLFWECGFWNNVVFEIMGFENNVGATIGRPRDVDLSQYGKLAEEAINNIPSIYPALKVDHYVIMPDHIHLLLMVHADENGRPMVAPTISRAVQQLKGYITKRIGHSIWQKGFFDHVIRNRQDYEEHVKYICDNPTKWTIQHQNNPKP